MVKNPPSNPPIQEEMNSIPGLGRSLEKEVATHSNILAYKILWMRGWGVLCVLPTGTQSDFLFAVLASQMHRHIWRTLIECPWEGDTVN